MANDTDTTNPQNPNPVPTAAAVPGAPAPEVPTEPSQNLATQNPQTAQKPGWNPALGNIDEIKNQENEKKKNPALAKVKGVFNNPKVRKVFFITVGVIALFFAVKFIIYQFTYVETDDAQVSAHTTVISTRVGGTLDEVLVDENQTVKQGQLLARLDDRDYRNAFLQNEGDLESLFARQRETQRNFHRARSLVSNDSITKQEMDDTESSYLDYTKKLSAQVALTDQAKLNLSYTELRAPTDGTIGKKSAEPGMVTALGQSLFTFVESTDRWVIANFKETQLRHMHIGQEVEITVDAIADKTFKGHVQSFAPGSGSSFALIPPDNATGNYTKIVQRVPVKITFDPDDMKGFENRIVPGLSVVAAVRVR